MELIGASGFAEWKTYSDTSKIGLYYPLKDIVIVGSTPSKIHRNERNQLHKDGAMALEYRDGWGLFMLNGTPMKPEYVLTPAEKLSPEEILKETNADQRRELIRKVGIERMLAKLPHKVINKRGDYEVLSVDLPGLEDARYLKMVNPSIKVFHLEGITREENTVEKALNHRNLNWFTDAEILT